MRKNIEKKNRGDEVYKNLYKDIHRNLHRHKDIHKESIYAWKIFTWRKNIYTYIERRRYTYIRTNMGGKHTLYI